MSPNPSSSSLGLNSTSTDKEERSINSCDDEEFELNEFDALDDEDEIERELMMGDHHYQDDEILEWIDLGGRFRLSQE